MTGEFVILGWSALIKAWLQTFPVSNYKHEHLFRLIINHKVSVPRNLRKKRSHVINRKRLLLMQRNTVLNTTRKKHLENTKYKSLGGWFSVTASSVFWNNFPNNYFRYADWRISCSELCSVTLNSYFHQKTYWVSNLKSFPYGLEREFWSSNNLKYDEQMHANANHKTITWSVQMKYEGHLYEGQMVAFS